jgi:hypothetical protein
MSGVLFPDQAGSDRDILLWRLAFGASAWAEKRTVD